MYCLLLAVLLGGEIRVEPVLDLAKVAEGTLFEVRDEKKLELRTNNDWFADWDKDVVEKATKTVILFSFSVFVDS